jgi:hypothetical protein
MGDFLASPLGSFLRVFVSVALGAWLLDLSGAISIDFSAWETYVVAGLASALPVAIAWLNPADVRFGNTEANS